MTDELRRWPPPEGAEVHGAVPEGFGPDGPEEGQRWWIVVPPNPEGYCLRLDEEAVGLFRRLGCKVTEVPERGPVGRTADAHDPASPGGR